MKTRIFMGLQVEDYETRAEWLAARRTFVGASEASAVLGLNPWESPLSVWARKTGALPDDSVDTERAYWGRKLEPQIAAEYQRETGRPLVHLGDYAVIRHPEYPFIGATLDRFVTVPVGNMKPAPAAGHGVLELKATDAHNARDWEDGPPQHHRIQVQHQTMVTNLLWGSISVLIGGNRWRYRDLARDDEFCGVLLTELKDFWWLVEKRKEPAATKAADRKVLQRLHAEDPGTSVVLPAKAMEWDVELARLDEELKEREERKELLKAQLQQAIGVHTFGVLPGGGRWKYGTVSKREYTVAATSYRELRRLKK